MVKKIGKFVTDSIMMGAVGSQLSSATGITEGSTMTSAMLEGSTKVIQPAMKIKGTSMVLKSVGKLKSAKLTKGLKGGSI